MTEYTSKLQVAVQRLFNCEATFSTTVPIREEVNGKILWEKELNSNPVSIPAVYEVNGRQYVAFFASSGNRADNMAHKVSRHEDQGYYVFALPQKK